MIQTIGGNLWQWDTGREVKIQPLPGKPVTEVHFNNKTTETALLSEVVSQEDGSYTARIFDYLLQSANYLTVYAVMKDATGNRTMESAMFAVNARPKPDDYLYTEEDFKSLAKAVDKAVSKAIAEEKEAGAFEANNSHLVNGTGTGALQQITAREASNYGSFAEGEDTTASGYCSHAEGHSTTASGYCSHVEGSGNNAVGSHSHVEGFSNYAIGAYSHVQGKSAILDNEGKYAHIVGNGGDGRGRSNAHTLDWDGNAWFAGSVEGTAMILESPDGTRFKITVDNSGALTAAALAE